MKVWITLDYLDGTKSRVLKEPVHTDEIDLFGMLMKLNVAGVAGVTFTRADVLQRLATINHEDKA